MAVKIKDKPKPTQEQINKADKRIKRKTVIIAKKKPTKKKTVEPKETK